MGSLTIYAVTAGIALAFCYLIYKVCLGGATFHRFNRVVLLSIYGITLAAPLLAPSLSALQPAPAQVPVAMPGIEFSSPVATVVETTDSVDYWAFLPMIYIAGMAIALAVTLMGIMRIAAIIKSGEKRYIGGATLVVVGREISPFSWGCWIVVSRNDADNDMVISHELMHIWSMHTADLMFAQLFAVFNWFNPIAWMMRRDLSAQHEYAVDEAMLGCGVDARSYQMLIVRKAVGATMGPLANCLHNSQLKNRVKMMLKIKSKSMRRLLAVAIVPAAIAAMAVINSPAVAATLGKMNVKADTLNVKTVGSALVTPDDGQPLKIVGYGSVKKESLADPGIKVVAYGSEETAAPDTDKEPKAPVHCTHENDAKIDCDYYIDGKLVSGPVDLNPEDIASVTVKRNPNEVYIETKKKDKQKDTKADEVKPDVMPQFPGGEGEIFHKLGMQIKYPAEAAKNKIQGKAVVTFVVNTDGTTSDYQITKSTGSELLDNEAIRACKAAIGEGWIPGKVNGKPVAVTYSMPVTFKLQ